MTATATTHVFEQRLHAALSLGASCLESAAAADQDDPISAAAFRSMAATAGKIARRMNQRIADLAAARQSNG